jgi:hypothetical protein
MHNRVRLEVRRTLDLEALERGRTLFSYRCFARLWFREPGGWSTERLAIVDTGAPFSVIPSTVWQPLMMHDLGPSQLRGIVPQTSASLPARLAHIVGVLTDEDQVSPPLELTALLVEAPNVPLILGWSGCLDRAKVVLDAPRNAAWIEF